MPITTMQYKKQNSTFSCPTCANRVARYKDQVERDWCSHIKRSITREPRAWQSCNGKYWVQDWDAPVLDSATPNNTHTLTP